MKTNEYKTTAAALGIIPWQRRGLIKAEKPRIHVMIVVPPEDKNHPLLQTMLASFHLPPENRYLTTPDALNHDIDTQQPEHLLVFGQASLNTTLPITHTHSLSQLTETPALKRETYVVLKRLGLYA